MKVGWAPEVQEEDGRGRGREDLGGGREDQGDQLMKEMEDQGGRIEQELEDQEDRIEQGEWDLLLWMDIRMEDWT